MLNNTFKRSPQIISDQLSSNTESSKKTTMTLNLPKQCFQYLKLPQPYDTADRMKQQAIFDTLHSAARFRFKCWNLPYQAEGILRNTIKHFVRRNAQLLWTASGSNHANLTIRQARQLIENGLVIPSRHKTKSTMRKHKCVICLALGGESRSFRRLPELIKHNMSHLNIKPYKCACCRRFRNSSDLQRHKRTKKCST